jgi:16S rRNA (cytosine967-C5)-methyltransferase
MRPGERVLDACAGRGAKASLIWASMQQRGKLCVVDAFPKKLVQLKQDFQRLGLSLPDEAALDWTLGQGDVESDFDRALVDAPCTGSGTLRKRPEILLRLAPEDPARMGVLQEAIVRSVATRLVPGGRLLYAVCSVFEEECEAVVARLSDVLQPVPFDSRVIENVNPSGGTQFRLLPGRHGTDGYFLASLQKR